MKTYVVFLIASTTSRYNVKNERHVVNADSPEAAARSARSKMKMKLRGETLSFFVNTKQVYL